MFDRHSNGSRFYQADNGEWFELKDGRQIDRVQRSAGFDRGTDDSFLTLKGIAALHAENIDRNGRFACMEGICEMGGAGTGDRSGRFACMEGVCES